MEIGRPTRHIRPVISCPECGAGFTQTRSDRKFCSQTCANAATNRLIKLGNRIVRHAVTWRQAKRGSNIANEAFNEMVSRLDGFIAEEKGRQQSTLDVAPEVERSDRVASAAQTSFSAMGADE